MSQKTRRHRHRDITVIRVYKFRDECLMKRPCNVIIVTWIKNRNERLKGQYFEVMCFSCEQNVIDDVLVMSS
jgi:hypothetical protein